MRVLFIHQNMPGQFGRLATALAADPANQVAFITRREDRELPNVLRVSYDLRTPPPRPKTPIGATLYAQSLHGEAVVQSCRALFAKGFTPDVVIGHPGWGELLFVKDLMPDVPLVSYCEFYHSAGAPSLAGDPPKPLSDADRMRRRAESAHLLLSLEAADRGWSPTRWQKSVHPSAYHNKIEVIFDGVDTDLLRPDPAASFELADGRVLRKGGEILTYAARALEPTRGFPTFIRALPKLLARRPNLQVLIAGDDRPHYDAPPAGGATWSQVLRAETRLDSSRVHFLGRLPYARFVKLLQVSRVHLYLTSPTVLSWSMIEAMSVGCAVVASSTPPVEEMVVDGQTGLLINGGNPDSVIDGICRVLNEPESIDLGRNARASIEAAYTTRVCVPKQKSMIEDTIDHDHRSTMSVVL